MREIAREIIDIKFEMDMTLAECIERFYDICRKHNIRQGTEAEVGAGIIKNNTEWTMMRTLFVSMLTQYVDMDDIFGDVPLELQA